MSEATVRVGFFGGAVTTGLHKLREQFKETREEANKEFSIGKVLAVGAILESMHSILESAKEIAILSSRFGIASEGLQRIGNVAKESNVGLEGVAMGMNHLVISQAKARDGSKEHLKALEDLGLEAKEFINLNPEEAFYKLADAVSHSEDRTKTYAAVVELMGRHGGALVPILQKGSEEIRKMGDAAGVMSEDTIENLEQANHRIEQVTGKLKAWGGEVLNFFGKLGSSLGVVVAMINNAFGQGNLSLKEANKIADEQLHEIWHPEKEEKEKKETDFDVAEGEEGLKKAEELQKLYDKIDEQKRRAYLDSLEGESKLNELIKQRGELNTQAAAEADPAKQAELWLKAGEAEKEIISERARIAKEEESRQDRIDKKRDEYLNKQFRNSLEGKTDAEKLEAYRKKKAEIEEEIRKETDMEKAYELFGQSSDLQKEIDTLTKPKKIEFELKTDSLAKIGGGGNAYLVSKTDAAERTAKAAEKTAQQGEKAGKTLEQIKEKIGRSYWNP